MIRVLVVDDHPWFREGLVFELGRAADIEVVAEAGNGREALSLGVVHRPDVVVLDLAMPVMDGTTALPGLVEAGARVLVLTLSEEDATVLASVRAGASGYLVKGVRSDGLLTAVRAVADGHAVFGPGLAARLLEPGDPELPELSIREREVMEHMARGLTNVEIAEALVISPVTVRNHVSSILMKLRVTNRTQAVIKFRDSRQPK
jgi:DNA-binding NarL/FixJ family response regulator